MPVTYVVWPLVSACLMSVLASYASFCFVERVANSSRKTYSFWLSVGAFVMGLGIWCMHYLGMLAVVLPVEVVYDVPTVIFSLFVGIFAAAVALFVVSRPRLGSLQITCGSIIMGAAIGVMHYTGMRAMRSSAMHTYNPVLVVVSVAVAIAFSWLALWIAFSLHRLQAKPARIGRGKHNRELLRVGGALLMGSGIFSMHLIAQTAVTFHRSSARYSTAHTVHITSLGVGAVALTTVVMLLGALMTALIDRLRCAQITQSNEELRLIRAELMGTERALREANQRLTELAIRDPLTAVYNRRHFDVTFETELRRATRAGQPLALLMLDVDHFKAYNDRHGHPAGDLCLRAVAQRLLDRLRRPGDFVARYGGEEFVIILPNTDKKGALMQAELVRTAVASLFRTDRSILGPVTISIGLGFKEPRDANCSAASLLKRTDEALYRAKGNGRNRVCVASDRDSSPMHRIRSSAADEKAAKVFARFSPPTATAPQLDQG